MNCTAPSFLLTSLTSPHSDNSFASKHAFSTSDRHIHTAQGRLPGSCPSSVFFHAIDSLDSPLTSSRYEHDSRSGKTSL